ncbi:unnamed protein product [Clonostachys rosea f. rosea IK726]|uniref:Heterokaryon incompatibility domain-containing protein n=2 Tax=Bionectria ochroleuca TaxID=29856 RepID=A0A0B7K8Q0_BIOOC|nr:unnamed protein product [Clonostachys rosea f. rosea IK726]
MAGYSTLRSREVRLLRISSLARTHDNDESLPSSTAALTGQPLCLSFHVVSLDQTQIPNFVALSYAWGDVEKAVDVQVSGHPVRLTRHLYDILQYLSLDESSDFFWIDALCINQDDIDERSAQVLLMREVYSLATSVRVFLSLESEPLNSGMTFLEQVALNPEMHFNPDVSPCITVEGLTTASEELRESFIAFFAAPWWTRIWPVQEYVLAKEVVFQCGKRRLEGSTIQAAFKSLVHHERTCCWAARRAIDGNARGYLDIPSKIHGSLTIFHATLRLDNLQNMLNPEEYSIYNLLDAMALFRTRDCSDPRDRIFGMLGLKFNDETLRKNIEVDYKIPESQLYESVALKMIESSESLNVLSHVLGGSFIKQRMHTLPSWVPDWTAEMDATSHLMHGERMKFLGQFQASGPTRPSWKAIAPGKIHTQALIISKISEIAPGYPRDENSLPGRLVLEEWRRLACLPKNGIGSSSHGNEELSQREKEFRNFLCGYLTPHSWSHDGLERAYDTWASWFTSDKPASPALETRNDAREFDNFVRFTSSGRRYFVAENGFIGFGPEPMEAGDTLVVIPGGRVPYVLRNVSHGTDCQEFMIFTFVGDASVQNMMFGEIMTSEAPGEALNLQDIILL